MQREEPFKFGALYPVATQAAVGPMLVVALHYPGAHAVDLRKREIVHAISSLADCARAQTPPRYTLQCDLSRAGLDRIPLPQHHQAASS